MYNTLTAQQMINRARSLADLPNAQFITYQDQLDSLNEAYVDVYEKLIESDDDFYVNTVIINPTGAEIVDFSNNDEYLIPLPTDFYKLRQLTYFDGAFWHDVDRHSNRATPGQYSRPMYRLENMNLHMLGMSTYPISMLRMKYYPPAQQITVPDKVLTFGTQLSVQQLWACTNGAAYAPEANALFYYFATPGFAAGNFYCESITLTSWNPILPNQTNKVSNPIYWKGSIYYLQSGNILSAVTDFKSTIVPTTVIGTGNVVNFTINTVNGVDLLYYSNGTVTNHSTLAGANITQFSAGFTLNVVYAQGNPAYLTNTGVINYAGAALPTATTYISMTSDGTNLIVLDSVGYIHQLTLVETLSVWSVASDTILASNITTMGQYAAPSTGQLSGRLGVLTGDPYLQSISTAVNTQFTYPYNSVNEIISYQTAVDFARKQEDTTKIQTLNTRLSQLWARYQSQVGRDDFSYERIADYYAPDNRLW